LFILSQRRERWSFSHAVLLTFRPLLIIVSEDLTHLLIQRKRYLLLIIKVKI